MAETGILPGDRPLDAEPLCRWRVAAVIVGLLMMLLSGAGAYIGPTPPSPGTTSISVSLRPIVPADAVKKSDASNPAVHGQVEGGWRVVPARDSAQAGDVTFIVQLVTSRTRVGNSGPASSRLMRGTDFPPSTTVRATLNVQDPDEDSASKGSEPKAVAGVGGHANLSLIADEVERRTGHPVMAKAVRRNGETVEFEPESRWMWWGVCFCGGAVALLASGLIKLPD